MMAGKRHSSCSKKAPKGLPTTKQRPSAPKSLEPEIILALLRGQTFDELIGLVEDDRVEAKGQPYRIEKDRGRLELAKDVASLAERRGGVILIGAETEKSPTHRGDEIRRLHPMSQSLIGRDQYHSILGSWVYPVPEGV